ncbi:unnamed protein product [Prunus brigantina]
MQTVNMEELSDIQRRPESQLKFITDAWQQESAEMDLCLWVLYYYHQYSCRHVES